MFILAASHDSGSDASTTAEDTNVAAADERNLDREYMDDDNAAAGVAAAQRQSANLMMINKMNELVARKDTICPDLYTNYMNEH